MNTTHFFPAEKQTGSIEQGSENAEYGGGSSSALAPFCCEETPASTRITISEELPG